MCLCKQEHGLSVFLCVCNLDCHHNFNIKITSSSFTSTKAARNLSVMIDNQLSFSGHVASVSQSCCFALYNIRKIRPYLILYAIQLLVQLMVISHLDYSKALLGGLPACTVKPLQMVQNVVAHLVFDQSKRPHATAMLSNFHWLPMAHQIEVTNACLQSDFWVCIHLLQLNHTGLCSFSATAFLQ